MPRRPRIEEAGYHHVINRGVARGDIFLQEKDYEIFLEIVKTAKERYDFIVHSLCLMTNHYHLLLETKHNNLSLISRQINSKYAQYFNREYCRVGPLWQGRFKNYFVYDESYLWILFRYIEQNPIKAGMVKSIGEYSWSASTFILNGQYLETVDGSQLFDKEFYTILDKSLSDDELDRLNVLQNTVYKNRDDNIVRLKQLELAEHFDNCISKIERNKRILNAFSDGYKQSEIARHIGLTNAGVSYIIKSADLD